MANTQYNIVGLRLEQPIIDGYPLSTSFRLNFCSDCTFAKIDTCYQWRVNIITNFFLCRSPQLTKAGLNKAWKPFKNSSLWYITDVELETLRWGFEDIFLTIKLFCTDLDHSGWRAMRQMLCVLHFVCLLNKDNRQWQKMQWRLTTTTTRDDNNIDCQWLISKTIRQQ